MILRKTVGRKQLDCGHTLNEHAEHDIRARALFYSAFQEEVQDRLRKKIALKHNDDINTIVADLMLKHADIVILPMNHTEKGE